MKGSSLLPVLVAGVTPFLILVLLVTSTGLGLVAWKPPVLWSDEFGTPPASNSATTVAVGSSGVYVEGYVDSSGLGGGRGFLFLSRYTLDGSRVWTHTIGNASDTYIDRMSLGSDGLYLSGGNESGRGLVLKYDLNGDQIWMKQMETGTEGRTLAATSTGIYLAGDANTPLTNQSFTGRVMFVREYDPSGNVVWTSEFSNASGFVLDLYAAPAGVFVAGSVAGSLPSQAQIGGFDAFLVKYDLLGNLVWARQFGTTGEDTAYSVSGDSTGVYVSGALMTHSLGFLRKYDFNGNLIWSAQIDPPDGSAVVDSSIALDPSGVYVSVRTSMNEFLMKYDLQGSNVWSFQMQSPAQDPSSGTAYRLATGGGDVFLAGSVLHGGSYGVSAALVEAVSPSPSLVFFGLNPPISYLSVGILIGAAVSAVLVFRRLRRGMRPRRVGPSVRSLPASD